MLFPGLLEAGHLKVDDVTHDNIFDFLKLCNLVKVFRIGYSSDLLGECELGFLDVFLHFFPVLCLGFDAGQVELSYLLRATFAFERFGRLFLDFGRIAIRLFIRI